MPPRVYQPNDQGCEQKGAGEASEVEKFLSHLARRNGCITRLNVVEMLSVK